jgi:hypothetical protein
MTDIVKNQKKAILRVIGYYTQDKNDFKLMYRTREGIGCYRWRLNIYNSEIEDTLMAALVGASGVPYMEIHKYTPAGGITKMMWMINRDT